MLLELERCNFDTIQGHMSGSQYRRRPLGACVQLQSDVVSLVEEICGVVLVLANHNILLPFEPVDNFPKPKLSARTKIEIMRSHCKFIWIELKTLFNFEFYF